MPSAFSDAAKRTASDCGIAQHMSASGSRENAAEISASPRSWYFRFSSCNRCSRWQQWRKPQIPRPSATLPRQAGAGGMTKGRVAGTQFWRMSVESLSASVDRSTRTSMFSSLQRRKPLNFRYPIVGNCGRSIAMKMGIS
jgi:hypothetical protein